MIKLVCPECQRQNEPERIYCHDCGARLDRSALAKVAPKGEDPKETQRRLRADARSGPGEDAADVFQDQQARSWGGRAGRAHSDASAARKFRSGSKNIELQQINLDLENAITQSQRRAAAIHRNAGKRLLLVNVVKNKRAALSKWLQFERALVNFDEGVCRITAERSLLGFSVFHAISYNVTVQNGTLTASTNGGSIGRLPIHPLIMKYGDILFTDLWAVLDREKKSVSKMGVIEFHPKTVILSPKSAVAAPGEPRTEVEPAPSPTPSLSPAPGA